MNHVGGRFEHSGEERGVRLHQLGQLPRVHLRGRVVVGNLALQIRGKQLGVVLDVEKLSHLVQKKHGVELVGVGIWVEQVRKGLLGDLHLHGFA